MDNAKEAGFMEAPKCRFIMVEDSRLHSLNSANHAVSILTRCSSSRLEIGKKFKKH